MQREIKKYLKVIFEKAGLCTFLVAIIINTMLVFVELVQPRLVQIIIDSGIIDKNIYILKQYTAVYLGIILISKIFEFIYEYLCNKTKIKVVLQYKKQIIDLLRDVDGSYIQKLETGKLIKILDEDISRIQSFGIDMFIEIATNTIKAGIVLILLLRYNYMILFPTILIQIIMFIANKGINKCIKERINNLRKISSEEMVQNEQLISNIQAIILTNIFDYFKEKIFIRQKQVGKSVFEVDNYIISHKMIITFLNEVQIVFVYFWGGILIYKSKMTLGELFAFIQYISLLVAPCMFLINANVSYQGLKVALENIEAEKDSLTKNRIKVSANKEIKSIKEIEYKNVNFSYASNLVLDRINIKIEEKGLYGLVGESGSGKTTLYTLLYRLWNPSNGVITINNKPIQDYRLNDLRNKICIVCQNEFIFDESIESNILAGRIIDEHEYKKKCKEIGIDKLIKLKADKSLGEKGIKLSGGQKEKIAITRALLSDADVIIFDEVTAALDEKSQNNVLDVIKEMSIQKIIIMIAHRREVLKDAKKIFKITRNANIEEISYEEI